MSFPFQKTLWCFIAAACVAGSHAAVVLSVDLNDATDTSADTAPGFTRYVLSDETLTVLPMTVTVTSAGGALLDDAHRVTPATGGGLTLGAIFRDTVFAAGDNSANFARVGLDTVITGLSPGKKYTITAWSFDSGAAGSRTSDWSVLGLGGPQFAVNNYIFDGSILPSNDTSNRFSVPAFADDDGRIHLRGRQNATATTSQVFLNGFTIDEAADAPVQATPALALDFNMRTSSGAANTQSGFQEFLLNGSGAQSTATTRAFGSLSATLTPVGGVLDDRFRTTPVTSGPFTDSLLLRDFIFASASSGLDLRVDGLTPNRAYLVELWAFDSTSSGIRMSDWTVNGSVIWDDYAFNGSILPGTNNDCKMAGAFITNASGQLLISGRAVSGSPSVFLNAARVSELGPRPIVDLGHPILSEFLASNSDGITDEDGDASDWLEIWNTTSAMLDLSGWRLTDDSGIPTKWVFPAGTVLQSQGRLLVWASGKNRASNPSALHTNFSLGKAAGAYLALSKPDGTIVTLFSNLPAQLEDISYGLNGSAEPLTQGFFQVPTPGSTNGTSVPGFVADTTFNVKRGYFTSPFSVHVSCATAGAQIFYTTDGSDPTTTSTPYPGAAGIPISTTTALRVKAFAPPLAPSNTDTQTYLFNAHTQNQPTNPPGWPATWGTDSEVATNNGGNGTVPADYEMDPTVVGTTLPGYGVTDALAALPSLSVVLNPADFHSAGGGIYTNPLSTGDAWERAVSVELLELDGSGFSTTSGVRVHGNSSRRPFRMQKHSFRLAFRDAYGDGKLNYKLFDDTTVKDFDKLVLHAFFTDGWGMVSWDQPRYRPDDSLYFRDPWMKKTFAEMGHARVSGRFVHVYINGLYWGIYELGERIDDQWCASHFGGLPSDYDVMGDFTEVKAGNGAAWNSLFSLVNSADLTQTANYNSVAAQVDLPDFADYYLLHVHGDAEDWPHHNGYAYRNRNLVGAKWRFVVWDQEIVFDPTLNPDRLSTGAPNTTTDKTAGRLLEKLKASAEFRVLFADRAHKHLHNGGELSLAREQARWQGFANLLDKAIVAESARWGDTADATPYGNAVTAGKVFKRETDWLPTIANVRDSHFPNLHNTANSFATITELRAQGLYPTTEPPAFSQFGGNVPVNFGLQITTLTGTIYYTINGTDPREAFTGNAVGTVYSGAVSLAQTCTVKARVRNGSEWSALTEAEFIVGVAASSGNLAVTELSYDPPNADHEFIELMNYFTQPIDLTGVHFEGITFTFPSGTLLAQGERIVVVRNQTEFNAQYGNVPRVAGQYTGALDNNGEQIAVIAANGADILRFNYGIASPWPTAPAIGTRSLVLRSPSANPQIAENWRSSVAPNGTPGSSDSSSFAGSPLADLDRDGVPALLEHVFGTSDTIADIGRIPVATIESFNVSGVPTPFLTFTAHIAPAADDVTIIAEVSTDVSSWPPDAAVYLGETVAADGAVTRKWRASLPAGVERQFFRLRAQLP